jgi:hypothetical protein
LIVQNDIMIKFYDLLLRQIDAAKNLRYDEEELLCDELDIYWDKMSEDEREEARLFISKLYDS